MFDRLLESSHRDDSNKWSNIGFDEEITQVQSVEVTIMNLIWGSFYLFFGDPPAWLTSTLLSEIPC